MRNKLSSVLFIIFVLGRCATDPGTSTPISGSSITLFTYARGEMSIIVNYAHPKITAAAVLFDYNSETLKRTQATDLETNVSVDWPSEVSFTIPGCGGTPTLVGAETYTTSKIFDYDYPSGCAAPTTGTVRGSASLTVHKPGEADKVLNGSGGSSGGGSLAEHVIFVTAGATNGNLGGLSGADNICNVEAGSSVLTSSLGGVWKAILSDSATDAKDRITLSAGATLKNTAGTTILALASNLWGGNLNSAVSLTANGTPATNILSWTGSLTSGLQAGNSVCVDWTSSGIMSSNYGDSTAANFQWIDSGTDSCGGLHSLYCINSED